MLVLTDDPVCVGLDALFSGLRYRLDVCYARRVTYRSAVEFTLRSLPALVVLFIRTFVANCGQSCSCRKAFPTLGRNPNSGRRFSNCLLSTVVFRTGSPKDYLASFQFICVFADTHLHSNGNLLISCCYAGCGSNT